MKKVFLTVSRGSIARNLLKNDFYILLREKYQVVMLTPAHEDERFLKEFDHPNVTFRYMGALERDFLSRLLFFFHKYLVYNSTVNQKSRWGIIGDPRSKRPIYPVYLLKRIIFTPLSRVRPLRNAVRFVDLLISQKKEVAVFQELLQAEKPDAVIVTNIADDMEAALLKAAKKEKVFSIATPKSWDNPNKNGFRVKANALTVWNELMAGQIERYQNYAREDIHITGVPQFDYYTDLSRLMSREDFCALYDLDPKKKIILFSSEGKLFQSDGEVASVIYDAIEKGQLSEDCQLLVRPHFGYNNDEQKFKHLFDKPDVSVDLFYNPSNNFRDEWDYSDEAMDRFLNMLYHSDININTHSSLTLDTIGFDTPIISIMFDGFEPRPYRRSVERWYETAYYREVLAFRATTEVRSPKELTDAVNAYLADPSYKHNERTALKEVFCYKFDGQSGKRFFDVIHNLVG